MDIEINLESSSIDDKLNGSKSRAKGVFKRVSQKKILGLKQNQLFA